MHTPIPGVAALALLWCAGCATTHYAPPEVVEAEEARLLAPYQRDRAVVSNVLHIDISANFYGGSVDVPSQEGDLGVRGQGVLVIPAVSPEIHSFSQSTEDGDDVYRWSSKGGIQSPLKFRVGQVQFAALQSATLRVRSRGSLVLDVTAAGRVTESEPGEDLKDWNELVVQNGLFQRR